MTGLTYDTGALIAAERSERRMWALHRRALERGAAPVVPAPVLVEGWRGSVQTARLLRGCQVEELDETAALAAGLLLGACALSVEATDAAVVEGALRRRQPVVTSNRQHLEALAEGAHRQIGIIDV
ncbi:MAG: PilT protein domain protein [Frankiales bacterium]|nr:PilT protein domain protein [Frankiales bacterium]